MSTILMGKDRADRSLASRMDNEFWTPFKFYLGPGRYRPPFTFYRAPLRFELANSIFLLRPVIFPCHFMPVIYEDFADSGPI